MGDRAEPCPTPTSALKKGESSLSQEYCVVWSTKYERKNSTTGVAKPILARKYRMASWLSEGKNWARSKATTLVLRPLAHPARTKCVRYAPASSVEFWRTPPN